MDKFVSKTSSTSTSDLSRRERTCPVISFPKNAEGRAFQSSWYSTFPWLEYSIEKQAAFCYACRTFNPTGSTFVSKGFSDWKRALGDKNKGFLKHQATKAHIEAMTSWSELKTRLSTDKQVSTIISRDIIEDNRYYVKSLAEVVQFLAVNKLAFRGNYDEDLHIDYGLFTRLFAYTLKKDQKLSKIHERIPANATYCSPEMQNEVIEILAGMVKDSVANDARKTDAGWIALLEDGTRDKNNIENISIGLRFVRDGIIVESLLDVPCVSHNELDALSLAQKTVETLQASNIDCSTILCQCYDGASVMSGAEGGVQAHIQKLLGRNIPYVHCFNQRLHLVIIDTISDIPVLKQYCDQCKALYKFLRRPKVASEYKGKHLKRLLEQRWSGHYETTKTVVSEFDEIISTLLSVSFNPNVDGDILVEAKGFLLATLDEKFALAATTLKRVLGIIAPADKILQARETGLGVGLDVVSAVQEEIKYLRDETAFKELKEEAETMVEKNVAKAADDGFKIQSVRSQPKRKRKQNTQLTDSIVTESCASFRTNDDILLTQKAMFYECIDRVAAEMDRRFGQNIPLYSALSSVSSPDYFSLEALKPLEKLGIVLPSTEEISVVNAFLREKNAAHSK